MTPAGAVDSVTTSEALSIMIVDDEAPARARLRDLLADIRPQLPNEVVAEAANGLEALAATDLHEVDIALVDIRMPRMDGIELANHLLEIAHPPSVIFVTAFDAYAVKAFELSAVDYLLKPVRAQRLLAALLKVSESRPTLAARRHRLPQTARTHLSCHERGRLLLVPVAQVLYFRADLKYVAARTREREFLLDESLSHLEQEFGAQFIRLHRSVLAARQAIAGFERSGPDDVDAQWQAILHGLPEKLPVSRRQWPLVKSQTRHPGS